VRQELLLVNDGDSLGSLKGDRPPLESEGKLIRAERKKIFNWSLLNLDVYVMLC
jgi:hypothetical protein